LKRQRGIADLDRLKPQSRNLGRSPNQTSPIEAVRVVLDNGITVILKEIHHAPIVSFQAYVKVGSIHEGKYLGSGISHFIEHLIDDGTERRTREEIDNLVEAMGNASNAYTTKDHSQYHITTPRQYLTQALDLLSDCLKHSTFPSDEVEIQRGVIWNELNGELDEPTQLLYDLYYKTAFREHPVRFPVGGYKELFMEVTRSDLVEFYRQHYVPDNLIFVAAGDFQTNEMLEKISTAFEDLPRRSPPSIELPCEHHQLAARRAEKYMDVELAYLAMGYHGVRINHEDAPVLDLIATVLGSGESSRLVQILKNQRQLVYDIQAWSDTPRYDGGCFGIEAELVHGKLAEAEVRLLEQIERLKSEPVSESELRRAQTLETSEYFFALQFVEEQGAMLGVDELTTGDCRFHEKYLQQICTVTPEDIQRVAHTYFRTENLTTVAIRNKEKTLSVHIPQAQSVTSAVEKHIFSNGIRLITKSINTAPVVSIQAMFLGGTRFETEANNGIFHLMTSLLLKGTKNRSAEMLFEEIEAKGGSIGPIGGHNAFGIAVNLLRQDLEYGLECLADVLLNPVFDPEALEKVKLETIVGIQAEEDDWYASGRRQFLETMFRVHPNRLRVSGSISSIKRLSCTDVQNCYQSYCVPNNMVIGVFGDVKPDYTQALVQRYLGTFLPIELSFPTVPVEPPLCDVRRVERHKTLAQAVIFQGYLGIPIQHADREVVEILSSLLFGVGQPGGRLYKRLRNEQLVYHLHGYPYYGLDCGYLAICGSTPLEHIELLLKLIDEEISGLQCHGVSDSELECGKQMCLTNYLLGVQAAGVQASIAVLDELYGLGYDYTNQYEAKITAVSKETIQRAANAYLPLDKRVISIIRNA
jgi:zinc protease